MNYEIQEKKILKMLKSYGWHGYDKSVHEAVDILMEVWHYVMDKGGHSGMSASFTDLEFISKTRRIKRLRLVDYGNYLFPQHFKDFIELVNPDEETMKWISDECKKKLKNENINVAPEVRYWWKELSKGKKPIDVYSSIYNSKSPTPRFNE